MNQYLFCQWTNKRLISKLRQTNRISLKRHHNVNVFKLKQQANNFLIRQIHDINCRNYCTQNINDKKSSIWMTEYSIPFISNVIDDIISHLSTPYLLASDEKYFDSKTHQRIQLDTEFDIVDGKPILPSINKKSNWITKTTDSIHVRKYWMDPSPHDDIITRTSPCKVCFQWSNGQVTKYSIRWILDQIKLINNKLESFNANNIINQTLDPNVNEDDNNPWKKQNLVIKKDTIPKKILWNYFNESHLRTEGILSLPFESIIQNDDKMNDALRILYQYGILLVTDTPFNDDGAAVAAFASAVSGGSTKTYNNSFLQRYRENQYPNDSNLKTNNHDIVLPNATDGPLRTLYGSIWSTTVQGMSEDGSVADSAYGEGSLPLHTDMTYYRDPPGLQIFQMIQPAISGGESIYADGLAIAEKLRMIHPSAFHTLCNTVRTYRSIDDKTGWHLEAHGSIIQAFLNGDGTYGLIEMIRHNDLDRLPDLPKDNNHMDIFYEELMEAHWKWDELIQSDEFRIEIQLKSGDMVAVANQRCLHGRKQFSTSRDSPRSVGGCYTSQDELNSRFRQLGFPV